MTRIDSGARLSTVYWRLWWAGGIGSLGDGVFVAAVPLLAVTITDDPRLVSAVSAAAYLPWLLLSLYAGVLVDRHDRAGLMWRALATQVVILGAIAILAGFGHLGIAVLAALAFALGACDVVANNAAQAIVPDVVAAPLLHKANGYQQTATMIGNQFAGPPLGGLLFAVAVAAPFGLGAVLFAVSAALLATLPRRGRRVSHPPVHAAIADGVRWLARHRLLRTLALLLGVNTFCYQFGTVTLVLLATQTLRLDARGYGLLLGAAAIGSVLGGVLGARIITRVGALPTLLVALVTTAVAFVAIGLSPNATVLGILLAVNGFVTTLWNIVTVSLRQEIIPAELLGRVNGVYRMLGWGLMPLGALAGGFVAHLFGLRAAYPVAGVLRGLALMAALPVLIAAMRQVTTKRRPWLSPPTG